MLLLGPRERLLRIALPSALPDIRAGVRVSLALALILTVVGQPIAAQTGVGYSIRQAQTFLQRPRLFAGLAIVGLLGFGTNYTLQRAESLLLRWRATHTQV